MSSKIIKAPHMACRTSPASPAPRPCCWRATPRSAAATKTEGSAFAAVQVNEVSRGRVGGSCSSVSNRGTRRRHEPLDASDSRLGVNRLRAASRVVVVGETLDLFDVEDRVALEEVQLALGVGVFVASVFVDRDGPRVHDE